MRIKLFISYSVSDPEEKYSIKLNHFALVLRNRLLIAFQ